MELTPAVDVAGGAERRRGVTRERPRWRSYLLLSRVSNLPTVWSNVLAGTVAAHAALNWPDVVRLAAGVSLLYTAGMFFNDVFDRDSDAVERPDRPIPAGDVHLGVVVVAASAMMALGMAVVAWPRGAGAPLAWSTVLVAAILFYNYRHKRNPFGPLVMGICRGLVYCVVASAVATTVGPPVFAAAAGLVIYVLALTEVAKRVGPRAGVVVPLLIAGISLFDAAVIGLNGGGGGLVIAAAVGFPLTLILQRVVPGT